MNELGRIPIKLYVWTLTLEFHTIFTWHEILFSFCFFQLIKTVKTILSLWDIQNQMAGLNVDCGLKLADPCSGHWIIFFIFIISFNSHITLMN